MCLMAGYSDENSFSPDANNITYDIGNENNKLIVDLRHVNKKKKTLHCNLFQLIS